MKQLSTIAQTALLGLALVSLPGCENDDEEGKPIIPYYQFTADDMQWLNLKEGDKWVFETASGKQQRYIVQEVDKAIKRPNASGGGMGLNLAESSIKFYSDETTVEIKRLDSLGYNTLKFKRTLPATASYDSPPAGAGEFRFEGLWQTYRGEVLFGASYGNMNITSEQLRTPNIAALEVKGKTYSNVLLLHATRSTAGFLVAGFPYLQTMYYAQKEGIVRMVSKSGEVWDRLP
jgi:hypothetical protein